MADQEQAQQAPDEELLVEIVPDEIALPEGTASAEPQPGPAAAPKVVTAEEGVAELRAKLEARDREAADAARRTREAEAQAQRAAAEVQAGRSSVIDSRIGQVDSALETMRSHAAETKRQYAAALAAGEYDKAADIQEQMAENAVTVRQLQANKQALEQAKKAPPAPPARQQQGDGNRLEAFLQTLPPRAQSWLRERPDFVTDAAKNKRLIAAHANAVLDHDEGSDGYFAAIEKQLGIGAAPAVEATARRPATVSAPPSRPTPSLTRAPVQQTTVRLTAQEVRMAEAQGMTPKEWAIEKQKFLAAKAAGVTEH